jgi:hypothetical protein
MDGVKFPLQSEEEIRILNDPNINMVGAPLRFSVITNEDWNRRETTGKNNLQIIVSTEIEVDGVKREVKLGRLKDTSKASVNDSVRRLRESIYNEMRNSGMKEGVFVSSIDTVRISNRTAPKYNSSFSHPSVPPHLVSKDFIMGVVDKDIDGQVKILTDGAENIDENFTYDRQAASHLLNHLGATIMFIRSTNGVYVPIRMGNSTLSSHPDEMMKVNREIDRIFDLFEKTDRSDVSEFFEEMRRANTLLMSYVHFKLRLDLNSNTMVEVKDSKEGGVEVISPPLTRETAKNRAADKVMRSDVNKINRQGYNRTLSTKGWFTVNMDPSTPFLNTSVIMKIDSVPYIEYDESAEFERQRSQPSVTTDAKAEVATDLITTEDPLLASFKEISDLYAQMKKTSDRTRKQELNNRIAEIMGTDPSIAFIINNTKKIYKALDVTLEGTCP